MFKMIGYKREKARLEESQSIVRRKWAIRQLAANTVTALIQSTFRAPGKEVCSCSLVSNELYHRSTSFQMKYTLESMVYCSHLPDLVSAGWLWRISQNILIFSSLLTLSLTFLAWVPYVILLVLIAQAHYMYCVKILSCYLQELFEPSKNC